MIIEMFGPAGCGKTTLSEALARKLLADGHSVALAASGRPAEDAGRAHHGSRKRVADGGASAAMTRAMKLIDLAPVLARRGPEDDITGRLLNLLPPRNLIWSLRYRRYLAQLCQSWQAARNRDAITIFDQGFLSALCSLVLLAPPSSANVAEALELLPRPDMLVRLDAPVDVLQSRLQARLGGQGVLERLFELDIQTSLAQVEIASQLDVMLAARGRRAVRVLSLDREMQAQAVDLLAQQCRNIMMATV